MSEIKYPDITVQLSGRDGNVFAIMGSVTDALRRAGVPQEEREAYNGEIFSCCSYDEALRTTMRWVRVE